MLTVTQLTGFSAPGRQAADSLSGVAALVFAAVGLLNPDLTGTAGLAFSATASLATGR